MPLPRTIPYGLTARPYQLPFLTALQGAIEGKNNYKRFYLVWHRRCLLEGTMIAMADGTFVPIQTVQAGDEVISFDGERTVKKKVLSLWENGEATTRNYNGLYATEDHRVWSENKWKEIGKSRSLSTPRELSFGDVNDPELAEVLGMLLTDGYVTKNQTPKFTNITPELLDRFELLVQKAFPEVIPKRYKKGKGFDIVCPTRTKTSFHPIRKYFTTSNSFPDIVWRMDKESCLAFLAGVIAGDGSIYYRKTKTPRGFDCYTGQTVIEAGISPELAEDYRAFLLKFGIRAKIKKEKRLWEGREANNTRVFLYSLASLHGLKGIRIPHKHKQNKLDFILSHVKQHKKSCIASKIQKGETVVGQTYDLEIEDTHNYIANGFVVHNSGKDRVCIADAVPRRLITTPCLVKYIYPTLIMGRENLWDGIGGDGFKYIDHIPPFIQASAPNNTLMKIGIKGGSLFQVGGSDSPDSLRGGNPMLVVFSEWAEQDPYAWDVIEPILRENKGIAIFNTTPKGDNHARALYDYAKDNPEWFTQTLTASDTGVWTAQELEDIRIDIQKRFSAAGRSQSEAQSYFDQEYMCSFTAPVVGSYYGEGISRAEREGRITRVVIDETLPVHTAWDLGMDDSMTIWLYQMVGREIHFVDYIENSGEGLAYYIQLLQSKGLVYGQHNAPHDIAVRELGTGTSRLEAAAKLGIRFEVGKKLDVDDGINAVRAMLSKCWFDKDKCERGINGLKNYAKKWDEKNKVFKSKADHNWASHSADAIRTMATAQPSFSNADSRAVAFQNHQAIQNWGV